MPSNTVKKRRTCVIVGAGPAGLTAAAELVGSHETIVLEKDPVYVGGISRTVSYKGFRFDLGGHRFFSKNPDVTAWWEKRLPGDFLTVKRLTRILYRGKFYSYPLKPLNALGNLGLKESVLCLADYFFRRISPLRPEDRLDAWVSNRFGDRLFSIFFKTYTEKVWGMPCEDISSDWAKQRIKGMSLSKAILNSLGLASSKKAKSLIESFRYPRLGPGMMWEKTRDDVVAQGGTVHMGRSVVEIRHDGSAVTSVVTETAEGKREEWRGDDFIVSMPLRDAVLCMRPALSKPAIRAAEALRYRDFILVALMIRGAGLFPDNWIYVHDPDMKVGRIENFNNWSPAMRPEEDATCLGFEYFCSIGDGIWSMSDAALAELAKAEARRLAFLGDVEIFDATVVRVEKAYPIYGADYQENVSRIRAALSRFKNLQPVGRNGMHKYNNQDHSMITAKLAAANIANGAAFDVWKVNTDAAYQEEGEDSSVNI